MTYTRPSPLRARLARLRSNEFLGHVLTLMRGTVLAQVIIFCTTPLLTRLVAPDVWGAYSAVFMAASGLLVPVAALRYDMAIVLPASDDEGRRLLRLTTAINTAVSLTAALAMVFFGSEVAHWLLALNPRGGVSAESVTPWMPMVGLLIWSYAQVNIVNYWSNRRKRYDVTAVNTMLNSSITAGGRIGAGWAGLGTPGLVVATVLGQFAALGHWLRASRHDALQAPTTGRSNRELLRAYAKMPLLNAPNAFVDAIRISGIPMMLAHYFGSGVTGAFNMAWTLVQTPMALINNALSAVFFQKLSVTPRGRMLSAIKRSVVRSALVGAVPFLLIWLLAPWLLPILLGQRWGDAGVVAAILVPWLFVNFITSPISTVFVVARRQGLALAFAVLYATVPLTLIATHHQHASGDVQATLRETLGMVSWSMGALLLGYICLALYVASAYDKGFGIEHDAQQKG